MINNSIVYIIYHQNKSNQYYILESFVLHSILTVIFCKFLNKLHKPAVIFCKFLNKIILMKHFWIFLCRLLRELKDPLNIIVYLFVVLLFFSPTIIGYLMVLCGCPAAHVAWATAYMLFWAGPFTPAIPIQLAITFAIARPLRRLINHIKYKRKIRWLL